MTAIFCDEDRTARKSHQCEECGTVILPGERYHRSAGADYEFFFTNTACLHCAAGREILAAICDEYEESYYGGFADSLDCWSEHDDWIKVARLLIGRRAKWRYRSGRPMPIPGGPA